MTMFSWSLYASPSWSQIGESCLQCPKMKNTHLITSIIVLRAIRNHWFLLISNYSVNILKNLSLLPKKFKFKILNFSENWIFVHNSRFSNSVILSKTLLFLWLHQYHNEQPAQNSWLVQEDRKLLRHLQPIDTKFLLNLQKAFPFEISRLVLVRNP